jgi:hypothetical protein
MGFSLKILFVAETLRSIGSFSHEASFAPGRVAVDALEILLELNVYLRVSGFAMFDLLAAVTSARGSDGVHCPVFRDGDGGNGVIFLLPFEAQLWTEPQNAAA